MARAAGLAPLRLVVLAVLAAVDAGLRGSCL